MRRWPTAWAAGLFEGEGTIGTQTQNGRVRIRMALATTDHDILLRFQRIVGCGNITGPKWREKSTKPIWIWTVTSQDDIAKVSLLFSPYLGDRRRNALERAWHRYANQPEAMPRYRRGRHQEKTHCPHGHPYSGDNLVVYEREGARRCRECMRVQSYRRRHGLAIDAPVPPRFYSKRVWSRG